MKQEYSKELCAIYPIQLRLIIVLTFYSLLHDFFFLFFYFTWLLSLSLIIFFSPSPLTIYLSIDRFFWLVGFFLFLRCLQLCSLFYCCVILAFLFFLNGGRDGGHVCTQSKRTGERRREIKTQTWNQSRCGDGAETVFTCLSYDCVACWFKWMWCGFTADEASDERGRRGDGRGGRRGGRREERRGERRGDRRVICWLPARDSTWTPAWSVWRRYNPPLKCLASWGSIECDRVEQAPMIRRRVAIETRADHFRCLIDSW